MAELESKNELMIQLPWTVPQQPLVKTQIQVDSTTNKIPLDIQHSTDTTAIWTTGLSFVVTAFIVYLSTKQQMKSNRKLIESQNNRFDKELDFRNKQLITQHIIEYASKYMSGQVNLIIKIRDFSVFFGSVNKEEKLDRSSQVGQKYQELRDISNQVVQDYHVLDLFLLSKGRAITNLEVKNRLFFNCSWRYLELILDEPESESWLKNEDKIINDLFEYNEFKNIVLEQIGRAHV